MAGDASAPTMETMNDDTWLVIPLFNEERVIGEVVAGALRAFSKIVCVDDGSRDGSAAAAAAAGATLVSHPVTLGQGAALQTGILYALTDPAMKYVVTFDGDGQHRVEDAASMLEVLRAGTADIVFGSRFLDARTRPPAVKRALLKAAVAYSNITTKVRLSDTHNGLRAFNRAVAEALDIRQNRMAHASEIIEQVGRRGFAYVEHPVQILYTDYSRTKGQSMLNSVNILAELFYR